MSYASYSVVRYTLCLFPAIVILLALSRRPSQQTQFKGCKKLGLITPSNLTDEHDERYNSDKRQNYDKKNGAQWRIKSLWIYPVKSCKGVELGSGNFVTSGMEHDRLFSFAQRKNLSNNTLKEDDAAADWVFVTQRTHRLLAKVRTEIWVPDPSLPAYSPQHEEVQSAGILVIRYPMVIKGFKGRVKRLSATLTGKVSEASFKIPLLPTNEQVKKNGWTLEKMTIWKDSPMAINMSSIIPHEFQSFLADVSRSARPLGLFRVLPNHYRKVLRCAPRQEQLGYQSIVGFADAYPLHIINIASVHDVEKKRTAKGKKLSCQQFRPNIIVEGPPAYAEDAWKRVRIGGFEHHVVCRTARCMLPNVDQVTGDRHPSEPDRTLRSFRCIDEGAGKNACLGMMMVPVTENGNVRIGDRVKVLETGDHLYIMQ